MGDTAYLILENGRIFEGKAFGVQREVVAEVAFATRYDRISRDAD